MEVVAGKNGNSRLNLYQGACSKLNQTITNFPDCHRCDITANAFLAKTQDILGNIPLRCIIEREIQSGIVVDLQ